jgi:type IV pilus assembly protein PilB
MVTPRVKLGELLVEAQIITRQQLEDVLALQKGDGRRLGTLLVESGLVTETQLTQLLSQQLSVPWVSLYHIDFSGQLLTLVPRELAEKHCLVPIFVRRVRGLGDALYVAMDDPSDENAQREVSEHAGLPVRAMIAPPNDIRAAIRSYYGKSEPPLAVLTPAQPEKTAAQPESGARPKERAAAPAATPPPVSAPATLPSGATAAAEPVAASEPKLGAPSEPAPDRISAVPESGPRIEAREIALPSAKRGKSGRVISLTLLDGTQISLPARSEKPASSPEASAVPEQLTARDLLAALRAASHGADASEVLGENARWEALFAALLSLLLKKHLILDSEFIDEYKKV